MSSKWAKHHMRENRNNQYRPEQQEMCKDLRHQSDFSEWSIIMEEPIKYVNEQGDDRCAVVDILIEELGVIYRLNGAIHNSSVQEGKDWEQKIYLEALGYLVIDVNHN